MPVTECTISSRHGSPLAPVSACKVIALAGCHAQRPVDFLEGVSCQKTLEFFSVMRQQERFLGIVMIHDTCRYVCCDGDIVTL